MTLVEDKFRDDRARYHSRDSFWDSDRWYRDWDDWPLDWPRPGELVRRVSFLLFFLLIKHSLISNIGFEGYISNDAKVLITLTLHVYHFDVRNFYLYIPYFVSFYYVK
ncbi:unnamed protein product [Onchocerca flexuosa]|uniref:Transmembrane protein n=1 Tax=Onchocerca flexuosa TaxID=387005 RepID=A0A183I8L6_9BILA|nr:unnamed protein product [Onchocerca flexuosa]